MPEGDLRRPARAQRRGQVDDDEAAHRAGDRRRGRARGARPRAARATRSRRGREMGVVPQLDNLDTTLTVEQNLLVFTLPLPRAAARAGATRSSARWRSPTWRDRRDAKVDELSGGMRRRLLIARALVHEPRLVLLDEPTVGLDPQVRQELWALIDRLRSEGMSILMSTHYIEEAERLADTVTIMSHGKAVARRPRRATSSPSTPGARRSRSTAPPARLREVEAEAHGARLAHAAHGHLGAILGAERRERRGARRRAPAGEPRGRLRAADRRGDRLMTPQRGAPAARRGRLERAALAGVLVREVINFGSFWRSTTFSSTVEPTIYLLAFGFGFGSLVSTRRRLRLRRVRRHRARSPPRCSSRASSRRCSGRSSSTSSSTPTTRSWRRPSTPRSSSPAEALWIAARAGDLRLRAAARGDGLRPRPELGHAAVPVHRVPDRASAGRASGSSIAAVHEVDRELQLRHQRPSSRRCSSSPARSSRSRACPSGRRSLAQLNPLYHCVQLVRHAVFGFEGWVDLYHVAVLVGLRRC